VAQCTAMSKRSKVRCRRHAMKGRTVCANHGGKSLVGVDSPTFKHGRYSKHLPDQLATRYQEALNDANLICLDDEIALVDSRIGRQLDLLEKTGVNEAMFIRLKLLYSRFQTHTNSGQHRYAIRAINELGALLDQGADATIAWGEINELIEQRRRLVETERKRLLDEDQMITIDRLMVLVGALVDIIRRNVASREERAAVSNEIRLLVERGPRAS
jgi:hypothetical protein